MATALKYRALNALDLPLFEAHLLRLDEDGLARRFGGHVTAGFLTAYAHRVDFANTAVIGAFHDRRLIGAGELRSFQPVWSDDAEGAWSVDREWRNRKVGTHLVRGILYKAETLRVRRVYVSCVALNLAMLKVVSNVTGESTSGWRRRRNEEGMLIEFAGRNGGDDEDHQRISRVEGLSCTPEAALRC